MLNKYFRFVFCTREARLCLLLPNIQLYVWWLSEAFKQKHV